MDDGNEDDGDDDDDDDDDIRHVNFTPSIPQPQSSQLSLSTLDKTVITSKNLILEYETDIDRYQRGPAYNKMSKETLAAEEKRKIRLIELETQKLSVYTEMQQEEHNARLEAIKKEKMEREAVKERKKYEEYNKRREAEEKQLAKEENVSLGLLNQAKTNVNVSSPTDTNASMLAVLSNQQSNMITIKKNVKCLHESVRELMEEIKELREDYKSTTRDMPELMEKVTGKKVIISV